MAAIKVKKYKSAPPSFATSKRRQELECHMVSSFLFSLQITDISPAEPAQRELQ